MAAAVLGTGWPSAAGDSTNGTRTVIVYLFCLPPGLDTGAAFQGVPIAIGEAPDGDRRGNQDLEEIRCLISNI